MSNKENTNVANKPKTSIKFCSSPSSTSLNNVLSPKSRTGYFNQQPRSSLSKYKSNLCNESKKSYVDTKTSQERLGKSRAQYCRTPGIAVSSQTKSRLEYEPRASGGNFNEKVLNSFYDDKTSTQNKILSDVKIINHEGNQQGTDLVTQNQPQKEMSAKTTVSASDWIRRRRKDRRKQVIKPIGCKQVIKYS